MLYHFRGVQSGSNELQMSGFMGSRELVESFNESWIPDYQRDRIMRTKKIESLIDIFKNKRPIDSVKLNLLGTVTVEDGTAVLEGRFHVIDGQQRLWALHDSGVLDYDLPVELYINAPLEEEIRLFHQYNTDSTKLTFGELAKSYPGPMADMVRRFLTSKTFPMKFSVNSPKYGLTLSALVPLMYWVHRRTAKQVIVESAPTGMRLKRFLQESTYTKLELDRVEFGVRNLLENHLKMFGDFDHQAVAYRRAFFLAWNHVMVDHFMTEQGTLDVGTYKSKFATAPHLVRNARVREVVSLGGGDGEITQLYDVIIDHFNHKRKQGRLGKEETQEGSSSQRGGASYQDQVAY